MADKEEDEAKGGDKLHDHPRSPKREKVTERVTEREMADEPKEAGGDEPAAEPGAGGPAPEAEGAPEMDMDARKAVLKRQETERNDHHALHMKGLKDMEKRHGKELGDLFKMKGGDEAPRKTALHADTEK